MNEKLDNFAESLRRLNEAQAKYDLKRKEYEGHSWDWSGYEIGLLEEVKAEFQKAFNEYLIDRLAAIKDGAA